MLKKKGITTEAQWERQRPTDLELQRFPEYLYSVYPSFSWRTLQGKPPLRKYTYKGNIPPFEELMKVLKRKKITTTEQWEEQRPNDPELQRFPRNLHTPYPGFSWRAVQGKPPLRKYTDSGNKPSLEELMAVLKKKGITTETQWAEQRPNDPELQKFPRNLHRIYLGFSWSTVQGKLPKVTAKDKPSEEELMEILKKKGITTESQWTEQRPNDTELQKFPRDLYGAYPGFSWRTTVQGKK